MKRYLITGLLIWIPLGITLWVLDLLIGTMDQTLHVLPAEWLPQAWLGVRIPGLGVILTLLVIVLTGMFGANFFGQKILDFWERQLIRIPVVKTIYSSVKQVSDTLLSGSGHAFRKVLLVRYPHPQAWSMAFQTNMPEEVASCLSDEYVAVFIPTAPSPVNGFYFFVKKSEVIELDVSVDRALKYIVSMGVASGEARSGTQ
ncbi:MAG TPA: DUF502 domain-containing protein [Thiobacillus sp.]